MPKNIALFSDGTGNTTANFWRTNVWRMFEALDLSKPDQVAIYADGVGTSRFKPLAILGGAFGYGLKRNVLDLYKFACRQYEKDDQIFGFGFSRGAFTIRVVNGLILNQGLVTFSSESELETKARAAYRAYRAEKYTTITGVEKIFRKIRDFFLPKYDSSSNQKVTSIRFIGVWDTVAAYGLPIEEMTVGISRWIWPLELPDRELRQEVERACHALAIDDDRTTFHPVLWTEEKEKKLLPNRQLIESTRDERISQVWFAGVHSNVGGGYPDDRLAYIPLLWMMEESQAAGLKFKENPDVFGQALVAGDKDGRLYNPRAGLGGSYRYGPRNLAALCKATSPYDKGKMLVHIAEPKFHHSVFDRIGNHNGYAPFNFPQNYAVVDKTGRILRQGSAQADYWDREPERYQHQNRLWDRVWQKRVIYFLSVAVVFLLFLFPFILSYSSNQEVSSGIRIVSETLRFGSTFLPKAAGIWINAYAALPWYFVGLVGLLFVFIANGNRIRSRIVTDMIQVWKGKSQNAPQDRGWIYRLRTHAWYQTALRLLKWHIVPAFSVFAMGYLALGISSHIIFNLTDSAGFICASTPEQELKTLLRNEKVEMTFESTSPCFSTGIFVKQWQRYEISMTTDKEWKDGPIQADANGIDLGDVQSLTQRAIMVVGVPFRRIILRDWFMPVARIGAKGNDEYFMDAEQDPTHSVEKDGISVVTNRLDLNRRDGELFLYVNDAGFFFWPSFYKNNSGKALVTISRVR